MSDRLVVALVRGVHGLKGDVRVEVLTDRPDERFAVGAVLHREGDQRELTVVAARADSPGWVVRFRECADRTAAESLKGAYLETVVGAADELEGGEFYWHDVIGTPVRDLRGNPLGSVVEIYRAGGVDAYVVRGGIAEEFDLPAVREFIPVFSPPAEIVVDADRLDLAPARPPRPPRPPRSRKGGGPTDGGARAADGSSAAETRGAEPEPGAPPAADALAPDGDPSG